MGRTVVFLAASAVCLSQRFVSGTVADTHGASIRDATVTVTAPDFVATATTDDEGRYRVAQPPGAYTLTIRAAGFGTQISPHSQTADEYSWATVLTPTPVDDAENVITSISDSASLRPQYLPGSGLWPGAPINLTGVFRVTETVQASENPPPLELNGVRITFSGDGLFPAPITYAGPNLIRAIVPEDLPDGIWSVAVNKGEQPGRGAPLRVNRSFFFAHAFTRNGLGFGTADVTNEAGEPFTFANPARPGSVANIRIVTPTGANEYHGNFFFAKRFGGVVKPDVRAPGTGLFEFAVPSDITAQQTSCAVPFQVSATNEAGETLFGNQVTLPISISGPCSDQLGFGAADFSQLNGDGIKILETQITEGSLLTTNRTDRILGRLLGTHWTSAIYAGVQPVNTCSYRWEPFQFRNPNAPLGLTLGGNASATVPWGQFNFTPTSNAGPYTLVFTSPANFTEGNYTLNSPAGFTVGGASHTFQASGVYQRPAGRMRDFIAGRAAQQGFWRGLSSSDLIDRTIQSIIDAPRQDVSQVFSDLNIIADNGTMGRHLIRCVADPTTLNVGHYTGILNRGLFAELIPERTNRTDVTFRFFPREQIRHNHANSGVDRSHVTFDSFITVQDVNGNR